MSEKKEGLSPEIKKERKKYYTKYVWKFSISCWAVMIILSIIRIPIQLAGNFDIIPSWIAVLLSNVIGMSLLYILIMIFSSVFERKRKEEFANLLNEIPKERRKIGFGWYILVVLATLFLGSIGRIIGGVCLVVLDSYLVIPAAIKAIILSNNNYHFFIINNIIDVSGFHQLSGTFYTLVNLVVACICAPIIEELVFRKHFIDRMSKYGTSGVIILSGLFFGMFHMNVFQFCFATLLGIVSAHLYVRTHKIIYSILLHFFYNVTISGVVMFNSLFINDEFLNDIGNVFARFFTLMGATHSSAGIEMVYNRLMTDLSAVLEKYPISAAACTMTGLWLIIFRVLVFAGFIAFIVLLVKFIKLIKKKQLNFGERGTKRCTIFNLGTLIFVLPLLVYKLCGALLLSLLIIIA